VRVGSEGESIGMVEWEHEFCDARVELCCEFVRVKEG
jgi:hypothetical protein